MCITKCRDFSVGRESDKLHSWRTQDKGMLQLVQGMRTHTGKEKLEAGR